MYLLCKKIVYLVYYKGKKKNEQKKNLSKTAQIMLFDLLATLNPGHGPVWSGSWPRGRIEPNRRIYDFELVYFSRGEGRVVTERGTFYCSGGSAILIPPGMTHCTIADSTVERWCIHFDWYSDCRAHREAPLIFVYADDVQEYRPELAAALPEFPSGMELPFFRRRVPPEFPERIRRHFQIYPDSPGRMLERKGVLLEILGLLFQETAEEGKFGEEKRSNRTFFRTKNRIDSTFSDPELSVALLAEEASVTPNHLSKVFKRELGISPLDYLLVRRLEHASKLLQGTSMTVREIAFACGFHDPNYFIRVYRKRTGASPGASRA